jgi:beta-phosphoglucomutase
VPAGAVIFDFNGTLSHDEPILCEIFVELFARSGRPLSASEYFDELAGNSDHEIVRRWLGDLPDVDVDAVVEERIALYRAAVSDGSTIAEPVRAAVRHAAARARVAVVSGAARAEIEPVLRAAGLADVLTTIVPGDEIANGKPHPEGYLRALGLLGDGLEAADVVVLEDTEAGVAAAQAAGMRCVAVLGTLKPERLAAAEEIVPAIDVELIDRLLA